MAVDVHHETPYSGKTARWPNHDKRTIAMTGRETPRQHFSSQRSNQNGWEKHSVCADSVKTSPDDERYAVFCGVSAPITDSP